MNSQKTIRVNRREEEEEDEEKGFMVEGYTGKTEEEAEDRGQRRISDEIWTTIVHHVVNHGLTMAEVCS